MNRNSALIWYPKTKDIYPTPKTILVPYEHSRCVSLMEKEQDEDASNVTHWNATVSAVGDAAQEIGYPVFIRTDLASAKHSGPPAYKANSAADIVAVFAATVEDSEMKLWTARPPQAIMVREFLHLHHMFTAFRGLPIAREWRFFADSRHVICAHPYWPAGALEGHVATKRWREQLKQISELPGNYSELCAKAMEAAAACGDDAWSVDFALDRDGKWWLIDMARMEDSWHWPGCPNGGKSE